ncbi:hypothetical protein [Vibrio ishigakensis]|uniref:hypothetical protein n=1 Tax=Vibrio ishigakensis TaxID=1481914 RepID=UPI0021C4B0FA|nr:hypothetical protein [Vibrio ishigakensis]
MNKQSTFLAVTLAALMAGCSDSDSSSGGEPSTFTLSGVVLDEAYKSGTEVCLDFEGLDETCKSEFTTTTDENGQFHFELESDNQEKLANAKITANIESDSSTYSLSTSSEESSTIKYEALAIGTQTEHIVVSPFTTQIVNEIALSNTGLVNDASYKSASQKVSDNQNLDNTDNLFEDYLFAADNDVAERATIAKQDMEKAQEIEQEILEDIQNNPDSPYAGWDTVEVYVTNLWQHSHHNHEFTNRVEHLVYMTRVSDAGLDEDKKEGVQWYVEDYADGNGDPMQNWREERVWRTTNTVEVHAYWEFDYNRDTSFDFKGEKGAVYHYEDLELAKYSGYETYNEGNPADEGAQDRPDREWSENCPVIDEINKIEAGTTLDTCVDFVEFRDITTTEFNKGIRATDFMTEWQSPVGVPVEVRNDNQDYYEERVQEWLDDGSQSYMSKHDWNAVHYHQPDLPHDEPFNEIKIEGNEPNGESYIDHSVPFWNNALVPSNEFEMRGALIYDQINMFSWMNTKETFISQRHTELGDGSESYASTTMRLQAEDPKLYYVDANGKPEVWSETEIDWDADKEILDAKIKSFDSEDIPSSAFVQHFKVDNFVDFNGVQFADMAVSGQQEGNDNSAKERPAFTSSIFEGTSEWSVTVQSDDVYTEQVAAFIFNSSPSFVFNKYRQGYDMSAYPGDACIDGTNGGGIQQFLQFEKGGDMYLTVRCEFEDSESKTYDRVIDTFKMEITSVEASGNFVAVLKRWDWGVNVFDVSPAGEATLSFQRQ